MAIATKTQYWTTRMKGGDPAALTGTFNESFSLVSGGGSASGGDWLISNGTYRLTNASGNKHTLVAVFEYVTTPADGTTLIDIQDGSKQVQIESTGADDSLRINADSSTTITGLDLKNAEDNPVPLILRVTLDGATTKVYTHEIINDDDGTEVFKTVTSDSESAGTSIIEIGPAGSGSVKWKAIYYTHFGAFAPDELLLSDFAQDTLARMGLGIVEQLKDSTRPYLKTQVPDSSIVYGYDLSSQMTNRISSPSIHVLISSLNSPNFESLGGAKITQNYDVQVFVTTRGTNYENAYRSGLNIMGEVFDELYTQTGVEGTTDSITSYDAQLDTKMDDDETVCVHTLTMTYMRRIDMRHR